ncbi:MAG: ATP-dependent Clp protease ATP-binding subunit [Candidatus Magasanikbacteria bacterium]|nr:ATP-dependent Clp protease ATP-binding subunit [Candidatus Magasanikbacteria bacterium]
MLDKSILLPAAVIIFAAIYYLCQKRGGLNLSLGSSSTPYLSQFAVDFTQLAKIGKIDPVIGREEEVQKLTQVLSRRSKNNALLLGDPGVGKTAIVEGLAQRIASGDVPQILKNKRVLALDVASIMSGTKYRGEFEQRAKKIVQEISASGRSIILFIDEVHSLVQSQGSEGAINFSDILKPALARGDLQMIGATTIVEYEKYIKPDTSLERRFQPVMVREANAEETISILQGIKDKYREYHQVEFTDAALETAVKLSQEKVQGRKLPDKAIDAIDEAAAMVRVSHLHESVPAILYQAAILKYPEIAKIWSEIQKLDKQIRQEYNKEGAGGHTAEREKLEEDLAQKGIAVVDSADVQKVIEAWSLENN